MAGQNHNPFSLHNLHVSPPLIQPCTLDFLAPSSLGSSELNSRSRVRDEKSPEKVIYHIRTLELGGHSFFPTCPPLQLFTRTTRVCIRHRLDCLHAFLRSVCSLSYFHTFRGQCSCWRMMKRLRLQVVLLPCDDEGSQTSASQPRQENLRPWLQICTPEMSLQNLVEQIVQKFGNVHAGRG